MIICEARVHAFAQSIRIGYALGTGTLWVHMGTYLKYVFRN